MTKVKCWEVSDCRKEDCLAYKSGNLNCWLLSGDYCREEIRCKSSEKLDICLSCDIFRKNLDPSSARKTFEAVKAQIARYKEAAKSSAGELRSMSIELAIGLSEVFEALKMIASGNPGERIDERSPVPLIEKLKHLVNVTAENIGEIVDQSHEFAMWLAEHFDVLHKVTKGELSARVSGESSVELLESLKKVTNEMIESVEREITSRERAENALRESEERLRSFFNSVTDFMFILDKQGIVAQVNPAVIHTLGYGEDEFIGSPITKFFSPASQEICHDQFPELLSQMFTRQEIDVVCRDGTVITTDCAASVVCNKEGDIINIVVLQKDITKRKRAEERLVQSLEALQSVYKIATTLRGSYEAVYDQVVYSLANLLRVSYVAVQHIEEDQVRIISKIVDGKFTHNEVTALENSACAIAAERKEAHQVRGSLPQLFPHNKLLSLYNFKSHIGVPIKNISGKVVGFLCVMDYEDRIFTEDEIRLIEIFSRYVAYEFERNVMETELRQLDRMKLLGQVAAGVAHEVRNPLNAILAITEALFQDIGDNPEYKPFLDHIRTQVDRLSRLMGDLLDLGKPVQPASLHQEFLPSICTSTLDLWKQTNLSKTHRVQLVIPDEYDNLHVMADRSKIQQVLLNLLENAAQHSPEGSEIQFVLSRPRGATSRIHVSDRCSGVPPENLHKVFEPFFTTRKRGNGLGLSLARNIMQAHGGNITIRNNDPPPGCTVEISIPVIQEGEL
jgi:PAS domain S-box-containing protein